MPPSDGPSAVEEFVADGGVAGAALDAVLWQTPLDFYGLADRFVAS